MLPASKALPDLRYVKDEHHRLPYKQRPTFDLYCHNYNELPYNWAQSQ